MKTSKVEKCRQTWAFNISYQSEIKVERSQRNKILKIYFNYDQIWKQYQSHYFWVLKRLGTICQTVSIFVVDTLHDIEGSTKWLGSVLCIMLVCFFRKTAYDIFKTISTDRNFTGKATATRLTNTSYQWQWLQDTFVLIQPSNMLGTVSGWKFMVSCYGLGTYYFWGHAKFSISILLYSLSEYDQKRSWNLYLKSNRRKRTINGKQMNDILT